MSKTPNYFTALVKSVGGYASVFDANIHFSKEGYPEASSYTYEHSADYGDIYLMISVSILTRRNPVEDKATLRIRLSDKKTGQDLTGKLEYKISTVMTAGYIEKVVTRELTESGYANVIEKVNPQVFRADILESLGGLADTLSTKIGYAHLQLASYGKRDGIAVLDVQTGLPTGEVQKTKGYFIKLSEKGQMAINQKHRLVSQPNSQTDSTNKTVKELHEEFSKMQPKLQQLKD